MPRKKENRVRVIAHVEKATGKQIRRLVDAKNPALNTLGKVIDQRFLKVI